MNLRGQFLTGPDGAYWFKTIRPVSYSIPDDGPVGQLLRSLGRHPFRPAHIHLILSAEGFDGLTTHLFPEGDEYLSSDAVFGVKSSLIVQIRTNEDAGAVECYAMAGPFLEIEHDFVLVART